MAGNIAVTAGSFWLSFTALSDLAARNNVPTSQAWVWPMVVDSTIIVATLTIASLSGPNRRKAWVLYFFAVAISLAGNAIHAWSFGPVAVGIAVVPPLLMLGSFEVCLNILTRDDRADETAVEKPTELVVVGNSFRPEPVAA